MITRRQSENEIESQTYVEHARDYDAYARRKGNVFSLDLNVTNDKLLLMSIGIVFHSSGAATEKARFARTVRVRGTARNSSADDQSTLCL